MLLTPSGTDAITASTDGTARVWDLDIGDCVLLLEGHAGPINDMAITSGESRLCSVVWQFWSAPNVGVSVASACRGWRGMPDQPTTWQSLLVVGLKALLRLSWHALLWLAGAAHCC